MQSSGWQELGVQTGNIPAERKSEEQRETGPWAETTLSPGGQREQREGCWRLASGAMWEVDDSAGMDTEGSRREGPQEESLAQSQIDGQSANKNKTVDKPNSLKYKAAAMVTALPYQLYLQRDSNYWRGQSPHPTPVLVLPCY